MRTHLARTARLAGGATVLGLLVGVTSAQQPPLPSCNSQLFPDIPYYPGVTQCAPLSTPCNSPGNTQCLDVHLPQYVAPNSPTILYIHGGGWSGGRKDAPADAPFFERLCQLGYRVVSTNYTLACDNAPSFPQAVLDVRAAVGWIKTDGLAYGLDDCIVVVGSSAGGNLGAMIGALGSDLSNFVPAGFTGVDFGVRLTITFSGDFDAFRRGCQLSACACPSCGTPHSHLPGYPNPADITERFVGFDWGTAVPGQYAPFPCPSGVWNYKTLSPGVPTADPFLNASPVHWLNVSSSPFYMFHSICDSFFTSDEPDWMIEAAAPYGIATKKVLTKCGHGMSIYGPAGTADEVDNAIRNWPLYAHCP